MAKIIIDENILCSAFFDANRVNYKMLKNKKEKIALLAYYILAVIVFLCSIRDEYYGTYAWFDICIVDKDRYSFDYVDGEGVLIVCLIWLAVIVFPFIIAGIIKLITNIINRYAEGVSSVCELYLTETQICGVLKTIFGEKELRIPLEKLDNVSLRDSIIDKIIGGKKLCILSNSGTVRFPYVQNSEEFMKATFEQLEKRKNKANNKTATEPEKNDSVDELKKYKELFDSGIITQEEFEVKKKQILNL